MNWTVKRLAAMAALGTAVGVVAPVASASAATPPAGLPSFALPAGGLPAAGLPAAGLPSVAPGAGFEAVPLNFTGPRIGQVAAVIGPTIITTGAGVSFINTNNQVSAGSAASGGQVTAP
jgi:hypothetical protein